MGGGKMEYFLDNLSKVQWRLEKLNESLMIDIYWGSNDGYFKCAISKWEFINSDKRFVYVPKLPFEAIEELIKFVEDKNNEKFLREL